MKLLRVLAAVLAVFAAAGCASGPSSSGSPTSEAVAAVPSSFGSGVLVGGALVTVGVPVAFEPSVSAAGAERGGRGVRVEVTAVNQGDAALPARRVVVRATAGGRQLDSVVDSAQGVEPPTVDVLPGGTLSWSEAWMAPDAPGEFQVQVALEGMRGYWVGQF
ncbi:hypothetical protein ACFXGA_05755 [Actinosynnema sp. NPDC059335]|uniref:hypothetical protein n=1 Tax=Actinosynnema sp. NPDC059335 TaxID=3346804 RepID=UPI00366CB196